MENIIKGYISEITKQQEKIIKEAIEQGHKYLAIKRENNFDIDASTVKYVVKSSYKYHGFSSEIELEVLKEQGFEVYNLSKAKELLNL